MEPQQNPTEPKEEETSTADQADSKKVPLLDRKSTLIVSFLVLGPLALPLLWRNPRYSKKTKFMGTVVIGLLTWGLIQLNIYLMEIMREKMDAMIQNQQEF